MSRRKTRDSALAGGAIAQALAYSLGKFADIMVQNPIATGMTALAINYAAYKAGFWDGRPEAEADSYVTEVVHHPAETAVDMDKHLIGRWLGNGIKTYPYWWRWWTGYDVGGATGIWQWTGPIEYAVGQPQPPYAGTYDGQETYTVNPVYLDGDWTWQPEAGWPDYPDPGHGGVGVWCPYHRDYDLILETVKPSSPPTAPPEVAYCWEAPGHIYVSKDSWDEPITKLVPGGTHYYNYYVEPISLSLSGIEFFKITKGEEASKVETGSRVAMLNAIMILAGTALWAKANKSAYSTGGGGDESAMIGAISQALIAAPK